MSTATKTECRKFSPNIFNKSKCQHCFACKDSHSAEALDNNRVSRKVSKCGYLFVAPDWDFSDPINRSKRWQRRWFVLFDDGELTYSVDEHAETVPQAIIDMTKVLEVSNAEDVTGNPFAIAIVAQERVHFIKGTSREESKWWFDVLSVFPRSIKGSRHKRNATFPGTTATTVHPLIESLKTDATELPGVRAPGSKNDGADRVCVNNKETSNIVNTNNKRNSITSTQRGGGEERRRTAARREYRASPTQRSLSDGVSGMIPRKMADLRTLSHRPRDAFIITVNSSCGGGKSEEKTGTAAERMPPLCRGNSEGVRKQTLEPTVPVPRLIDKRDSRRSSLRDAEKIVADVNGIRGDRCSPNPRETERLHVTRTVRGDPDGCGLDKTYTNSSDAIEEEAKVKKGWLMRHDVNNEWNKVWCVLGSSTLKCYEDSSDEANGLTNGVVSLSQVERIQKLLVSGHYSFQLVMVDGTVYLFSAITATIRSNWICALQSSVGIANPAVEPLVSLGEKIEKEMSLLADPTSDVQRTSLDVPSSPRSGLSSDDEFKTASEASGRTEDYFEWADEDVDQTSSSRALPPSPPLNRTPISRVKERARTRTSSRGSLHLPEGPIVKGTVGQRTSKGDMCKDDLSGSDRETSGSAKNGRRRKDGSRRRNSSGTTSDVPEFMLVELLEMEVESLKDQLEQCQVKLENQSKATKESRVGSGPWQQRTEWVRELESWQKRHADLLSRYHGLRKRMELLEETCLFTEREHHLLLKCEALEERFQTERTGWENKRKVLEGEWNARISDQQKTIDGLEERLRDSEAKIVGLIEEMEVFCRSQQSDEKSKTKAASDSCYGDAQMEVVGSDAGETRKQGCYVDSLSDLSDVSFLDDPDSVTPAVEVLKNRLHVTVSEIRALKQEIRQSHGSSDALEVRCVKLQQELNAAVVDHRGQLKLMAERVEDLTGKLSACEKQNRMLRQKLVRGENKEQRRTRSLKGKEMLVMSKELEAKVSELERKLSTVGEVKDSVVPSVQGADEENCGASMQLLMRIDALENKVEKARDRLVLLKRVDVTVDQVDSEMEKTDVEGSTAESILNRIRGVLDNKLAFFKEKEAMLAQLGLLNKQSLFRLNVERMVHEASLVGQMNGVLRLAAQGNVAVRREARRLSHQVTLFEKKMAQLKIEGCPRGVRQLVSNYKATRLDDLSRALFQKMKKDAASCKVDVLSQKVMEVELRRMVTSLVHLKEREVTQDAEIAWIVDESADRTCKLECESMREEGKLVVAEIQQRLRDLMANSGTRNDGGVVNVDGQLAEFVETVTHGIVLISRGRNAVKVGNEDAASSSLVEMAEDAAVRELDLLEKNVDNCVEMFVRETRTRCNELSAEWPKNWKRSVEDILKASSPDGKPSFFLNTYEERTRRSFRQRSQRSVTMPICCPIEPPVKELGCADCREMKGKLDELKDANAKKWVLMEAELRERTKDLEELRSKLEAAEQKLSAKEAERFQQISALKEAYGRENAWKNDSSSINEEAVRQRYQAEIEQLRGLCEKGLVAMENSHRRIIAELEEKHQRELEQILVEKEQALAEETQATLAALDAMRKAHEAELQREIAKFKRDFLEKMQSTDTLHKEQEEEMETIKQEILSLSEKYSVKCLENASLEERLKIIVQQMADANSLAFDLTARNKQLRAALNTQTTELRSLLDDQQCQLQFKLKSNELKEKEEQVADLQRQLQETRRHEANLEAQRQQLDQSLKAERRLRQDEVSSLRDRLEHIVLTGNASLEVFQFSSFFLRNSFNPSACRQSVILPSAVPSCRLTADGSMKETHVDRPLKEEN